MATPRNQADTPGSYAAMLTGAVVFAIAAGTGHWLIAAVAVVVVVLATIGGS